MQDRFLELTTKSLRGVARHKPAVDMTIYPNGNHPDGSIDPLKLVEDFRKLEAQISQDVRVLRRRIKRRSPL